MTAPEVRLSPDSELIALRFAGNTWWTISGPGSFERVVSDDRVSGWTPLLPASNKDGES